MTDSALHEACTYTWTTEKQLVSVLDKCLELAGHHNCLEEVDELVSIHKLIISDCTELLASLGVERSGTVVAIVIPADFQQCIILVHAHFMKVIDNGYIKIDAHANDPVQRTILERVTRRRAEQVRIIRVIAVKCQITLPGTEGEDHRPPPGPPHHHPPKDPPHHPSPPSQTNYVVQPGDTMFNIAKRFGVSLEALIRANPQIRNPNMIVPGEIIRIPGGGHVPPKPGPGPGPGPGPSPGRRYVVQPGDTMFLIAQRFAVSLDVLIAFNPQIPNPNVLVPGQVVLIPTSGGALG